MTDIGWRYHPSLNAAVSLAAGIAAAGIAEPSTGAALLALGSAAALLAACIRRRDAILAAACVWTVFCGGLLLQSLGRGGLTEGLEGTRIDGAELVGRVTTEPVRRNGRIEYIVDGDSIVFRNGSARVGCGVLVRLYDTSWGDDRLPGPGERIACVGSLSVPEHGRFPGDFDRAGYLRSRGIELVLTVDRARTIERFGGEGSLLMRYVILPVRSAARDFARKHVRGPEGEIVLALLIDERHGIEAGTREAFMRTGTVHVLAVSGLHVGVIAIGLFVIVSWIPGRWRQIALYAAAIGLYTAAAGAGPSIVRAAIMGVAVMVAARIGRPARPLNTLGLAALLILTVGPGYIADIGFQLSFASLGGLILLYGPLWRSLEARFPIVGSVAPLRRLAQGLLLSLAAQIFTLPLTLYHFGYVSLISLPVNLAAVPLTSGALAAGAVGAMTGWAPGIASLFGGAAYVAVALTESIVLWGAGISWAGIDGVSIGVAGLIATTAGVLYAAAARTGRRISFRLLTLGLGVWTTIMVERTLDPLRRAPDEGLYLLPGRGSVIVAATAGDTLTGYMRGETAGATAPLESLRRRVGVSTARIVRLDSVWTDRDLLLLNDMPPEYALRSLPVVISPTRSRQPGLVRLGGAAYLQIPLDMRLEKGVVLRYTGRWERL